MTSPGSGRSSIGVRVRPNADNFIRDLKAQLASRRYTFWVDVRAKTSQATKDVRQWADGALKGVKPTVSVGADMTRATRDVKAWGREISALTNGPQIKVRADTAAATANVKAWRTVMGRDVHVKVKADIDRDLKAYLGGGPIGGASRTREATIRIKPVVDRAGFQRRVNDFIKESNSGLLKITPELDLDKNVSRGFKSRAEALIKDLKPKVKVDLDDKDFRTRLNDLTQSGKIKVRSELDLDIHQAENQVRELEIRTLAKKLKTTIDIDADPKKADAQLRLLQLRARAKKLSLDVDVKTDKLDAFTNKWKQIEKTLGKATFLRSFGVGPFTFGKSSGLVGTLATLTALVGVVPTAVTAMSALSDVMVRLAGAAAIVPGAIGGIAASVATLAFGTHGVSDAFSAMFDMWNEGASQQRSQVQSLVASHNSYRNAVVDEAKAQQDVGKARRDSLNDLRDLNNELRGSVLNEAQAILDAQKARDRYAQSLAEGFGSETDRVQGLLDIAKADQNILDVREKNAQLQQKVNDAQSKGVDGSDKVRDALEAQTRAAQATATAAQQLADAEGGAGTAAEKFADKLGLLSPNAKDFVTTFGGLKDQIVGFRNNIQDIIFQGLGPALKGAFTQLLPVIAPGMEAIARGLNANILQIFDSLQSPGGKSIIERLLGGTAQAQASITKLIDPLVRGVGTLVAAGAEHLPQIIDLFTRLADRFANFIEEADRSGNLDKFLDKGVEALGNMAELGINLVKIVGDLARAFGGDALSSLVDLTNKWHEFLSSEAGQQKIKDFITDAKNLWAEWAPIIKDLITDTLPKLGKVAKDVLDKVLPIAEKILDFLNHIPGAIEVVIGIWLGARFAAAVSAFGRMASLAGGLVASLGKIPGLINKIPGINIKGLPGADAPGGAAKDAPGGAPKPGTGAGAAADAGARVGTGGLPGYGGTGQPAPGGQPKLPPGVPDPGVPSAPKSPGPGGGGGKFTAGMGALARIAGPLGIGVAIVSQIADEHQRSQIFNEYQKQRDALSSDEDKRKFDKEFYSNFNIDIGDAGAYPKLDTFTMSVLDDARRGNWGDYTHYTVKDGKFVDDDGHILFGFKSGGYTNWSPDQGRAAILHGKEFVQPTDSVSHYGVGAMEAIRDKTAVIGMKRGGYIQQGPNDDPNQPTPTNAAGPNPAGGPGLIPVLIGAATGIGGKLAASAGNFGQDAMKHPGEVDTFPVDDPTVPSIDPMMPTGPLPGPAGPDGAPVSPGVDASGNPTYGVDTSGGQTTPGTQNQNSINLFGINIPIGGQQPQDPTRGWGSGGPPPGLGGIGDDGKPFDIRNYGIGPGPPGSGPSDWMNFIGQTAGTALSSLATSFISGALGFFGLEGVLSTPTARAATGIASHFLSAPGASGNTQGPTDASNQASDLLNQYSHMPTNPADGSAPNSQRVPDWDAIAQKESRGDWSIDHGDADSTGGLQIQKRTWDAFGGPALTGKQFPYQATKEQQIAVAEKILAVQGPKAWADGKNFVWKSTGSGGMPQGAPPPGNWGTYDDIAAKFHLTVGSSYRPANGPTVAGVPAAQSYHASGRAHDYNGTPEQRLAFANYMAQNYGGVLKELIYDAPGFTSTIKNGKIVGPFGAFYTMQQAGDHSDHVHIAFARGGQARGPGGPKGDMIPALLSDREYVQPSEAVDHYGVGFMDAIRSKALPRMKVGGIAPMSNPVSTRDDTEQIPWTFGWQDKDGKIVNAEPTGPWSGWGIWGGPYQPPPGVTPSKPPDGPGTIPWPGPGKSPEGSKNPIKLWGSGLAYGGFITGDLTNPPSPGQGGWWDPPYDGGDRSKWGGSQHGPYSPPEGGINVGHGGWLPWPRPETPSKRSANPIKLWGSGLALGGFPRALPLPPPRPRPVPIQTPLPPPAPIPPPARAIPAPQPAPQPLAPPPQALPQPQVPPVVPTAPPPGPGEPPPPPPAGERQTNAISGGPAIGAGPGPSDTGMHLHPAIQKGIDSAASTIGSLADTAASMGTLGVAGGLGGGGGGLSIGGLIQQGGKIVKNIANIGASFLVGNITAGTTANAYGVTQQSPTPTGGTRVVDASSNHYGDMYTNDLDSYFAGLRRREDQKAQVNLGQWGR